MNLKRHLRHGVIALAGLAATSIGGDLVANSGSDQQHDALVRGKELFTRGGCRGTSAASPAMALDLCSMRARA